MYRPSTEEKKDFHTRCHSQKTPTQSGTSVYYLFVEAGLARYTFEGSFNTEEVMNQHIREEGLEEERLFIIVGMAVKRQKRRY